MASIDNQHIDNIDSQCKIITVIDLVFGIKDNDDQNNQYEKNRLPSQSLPQRIGVMAKKTNVK